MPALYGRVGITQHHHHQQQQLCKPQRAGFAEIYKHLPSQSVHVIPTFLARLGRIFRPTISTQPSQLHDDDGADFCAMRTATELIIPHFLCRSVQEVGPRRKEQQKSIALDERSYRKRVNQTVPTIIDYCLSLILRVRFFFFFRSKKSITLECALDARDRLAYTC